MSHIQVVDNFGLQSVVCEKSQVSHILPALPSSLVTVMMMMMRRRRGRRKRRRRTVKVMMICSSLVTEAWVQAGETAL